MVRCRSIERRRGFALVLSLLLMAMLVLLVLSLATLGRMEIMVAESSEKLALARQHARYSLELALAQLQENLGPDRRPTARAEMMGAEVAQPYWTGVWNGLDPAAMPVWLVSGEGLLPGEGARPDMVFDPADEGETHITLVGRESVGAAGNENLNDRRTVRAPLVAIQEPDMDGGWRTMGRYAYWIGDESVKASLQLFNRIREVDAGAVEAGEARLWRSDLQRLLPNPTPLATALNTSASNLTAAAQAMPLVGSEAQLALLKRDDDPGAPITEVPLQEGWHDFSFWPQSVLTNMGEGGLKWNVSDPGYTDEFVTPALRKYLDFENVVFETEQGVFEAFDAREGTLSFGYDDTAGGDPYAYAAAPVLTEAMLYAGIYVTNTDPPTDKEVRVRFHLRVEYWNPYSFPLRFPEISQYGRKQALRLIVENLPHVNIVNETQGLETGFIDMNYALNSGRPGYDYRFVSWLECAKGPDGEGENWVMEPGEVYQLTEPDPLDQPRGLARTLADGFRFNPNDRVSIEFDHRSGPVTFRLIPFLIRPRGYDYSLEEAIFEVSGIAFENTTFTASPRADGKRFLLPSSGSYTMDDYTFGYYFRVNPDTVGDYLELVRRGIRRIDAGERYRMSDGHEVLGSELFEVIVPYPDEVVDFEPTFWQRETLFDLDERTHRGRDRSDLRVLDPPLAGVEGFGGFMGYPDEDPWNGGPAVALGQASGHNEWNLAYDRYAFVSVPDADPDTLDGDGNWEVGSGDLWPNQYLRLRPGGPLPSKADLRDSEAARYLMLAGGFNVNSFSPKAWKALLLNPVEDWVYEALVAREPGQSANLEAVYGRHLRGLGQLEEVYEDSLLAAGGLDVEAQLAKQGLRSLSGDTVDALAEAIVGELRAYQERLKDQLESNRPISSLKEFADLGILQRAMDAVTADPQIFLNDWVEELQLEPALAMQFPGMLTQAEILNRVAPLLTTRGDTFRIRGYGDVKNPFTGRVEARAWYEAIVQRYPEKLDGTGPMFEAASADEGRRFEVVSFRWIDEPNR